MRRHNLIYVLRRCILKNNFYIQIFPVYRVYVKGDGNNDEKWNCERNVLE